MENIAKALIKAQSEMGTATKGSANPFFKSRYADLNSIREVVIPALNANGIVVLQPTVSIDGRNYVRTMLLHSTGESISSDTEILFVKANDPQAQGSGITYARRYGLQSLLCVGAEDDDANKASGLKQAKTATHAQAFNKQEVELSDVLADSIAQCADVDVLHNIWVDNEAMHGNNAFKSLIKKRKEELKNA